MQHLDPFVLQPLLPFEVGLLVETGPQLEHDRYVFAVADGIDQGIDDLGIGWPAGSR